MVTVFQVIKTTSSISGAGRYTTPSAVAKIHKSSYKKAKSQLDLCVSLNLMYCETRAHRPNVRARYYRLTSYGMSVQDAVESARLAQDKGLPF